VVFAERAHSRCVLIVESAAAIVLVLVALACWHAALTPVALVLASAAAIVLTVAPFSAGRIVWSDVFALAFIGLAVATALVLQRRPSSRH
jgi:hypothetical protein